MTVASKRTAAKDPAIKARNLSIVSINASGFYSKD